MSEGQDTQTRNWCVAVVGAGPSGLYAADALVKRGARVDVFEAQFSPFGLVRYGVAPDHQKIKRTQLAFDKILRRPAVRLFSNVAFGSDVFLGELLEHYDQVLFTVGSPGGRLLGIPGEDLLGSTSATDFVNWYNGHPAHAFDRPDLSHERAVVVGMGNVAIDVARILTRDPDELASTDITRPALDILRTSRVDEVVLLARRGPNQAKFDIKEARELASLPGVEVVVDGYISKRKTEKSDFILSFPRADDTPRGSSKRVVFRFCASPKSLRGEDRVRAVVIERNDLVESAARMKAVGTGDISELETGLVVRAIGYEGRALPDVPFCEDTGTIPNDDGRVLDRQDGGVVPRLYVAGWIKRGPTGLIGTNKGCAVRTVEHMETDLDQVGPLREKDAILSILRERGVRYLSYEDYRTLDAFELREGKSSGKIREKVLCLDTALEVIEKARSVVGT